MKQSVIVEIISSLFILLFIYTASSKLLSFQAFEAGLVRSTLIGSKAIIVAVAVPVSEIIISLWLLIPATRLLGLYASLVIMTVFTLYIGYMMLFAAHLPCSCGAVFKHMGWRLHLLFNIFCIALTITGIWLYKEEFIKKEKQQIVFT